MQRTSPLVSIAVPTYKQAQYLPACLDALWFQDYPNIEIVVVNAASPDNTREVLDRYEREVAEDEVSYARYFNEETDEVERQYHPRYPKAGRTLKVIHLEQDPGLSETYNLGVRESQGKFVTTIVSDDIPHPKLISRLMQALEEKQADFAYADAWLVEDSGRIVRQFDYPDYDPRTCLADWYLMGSAKLWRRELHERAGWFSTDYPLTQDYELFFRFAEAGARIVHVPEVLYSIRWHGPARKTGNHSPEREPRIFSESKETAKRARAWLASRAE
ncbi:MAG: glycosyltransferase [Bdellovibrionales bacterium]|nr:glycosyltransferase [Bdellovibrionales bacterium]